MSLGSGDPGVHWAGAVALRPQQNCCVAAASGLSLLSLTGRETTCLVQWVRRCWDTRQAKPVRAKATAALAFTYLFCILFKLLF